MVKAYHKLLNSEDDNVRYVAGIGVQPVLILTSAMRQSRGRQSLVQMGVSRSFESDRDQRLIGALSTWQDGDFQADCRPCRCRQGD